MLIRQPLYSAAERPRRHLYRLHSVSADERRFVQRIDRVERRAHESIPLEQPFLGHFVFAGIGGEFYFEGEAEFGTRGGPFRWHGRAGDAAYGKKEFALGVLEAGEEDSVVVGIAVVVAAGRGCAERDGGMRD